MRNALIAGLAIFACSAAAGQEKTPEQETAKKTFDPGRAALEIPEDLWTRVVEGLEVPGGILGYTSEQMAPFADGTTHILPRIERLFRDAREVPRLAGATGDFLLANSGEPSQQAWFAFRLLGAMAARGVETPGQGSWGVDWIAKDATVKDALGAALSRAAKSPVTMTADQETSWNALSERDRILAARLAVAAVECSVAVRQSFDAKFLYAELGQDFNRQALFEFSSAPWRSDSPGRASFAALDKIDLKFLALGSIAFLKLARAAVEEWKSSKEGERGEFTGLSLQAGAYKLLVLGTGADEPPEGSDLVIDLGGDDHYKGRFGAPSSLEHPISLLVDLGGNDRYEGGSAPASIACGLFGVGVVIDAGGNDVYEATCAGLGYGLYGTGVLVDETGNDTYKVSGEWGQGAACAGVGLLADLAGDDTYFCGGQSQGFGSTLGAGILLDVAGSDAYAADLTKNLSKPFGDRPVSFAQGAAFGRRADFGDGHSLGGGFGILVDGGGNDSYTAGVYGQGTGYWWGLGMLEDRAGDDSYSNQWYSAGSAPHFAIGCLVDLAGNDRYNVGNSALQCQTQGCARDASIGWFIDGAGNDEYFHTNRCAGSADLNSIAIFWDRAGRDRYLCDRNRPYPADRSFGGACEYPPFGGFRDKMVTWGLFLDTGGKDEYIEIPLKEPAAGVEPLIAGNDRTWKHNSGARFRAFGLDTDHYAAAAEGEKARQPPGEK